MLLSAASGRTSRGHPLTGVQSAEVFNFAANDDGDVYGGPEVPVPSHCLRRRPTARAMSTDYRVGQVGQYAGHAATPIVPDCRTKKSAACCALDAAEKIARLSAFRTRSHE